MPLLTAIPPALRVEETCDFCLRSFARTAGASAICPSCGLANPRTDPLIELEPENGCRRFAVAAETAMLGPAAEAAVINPLRPRKRFAAQNFRRC